MWSVTYLPDPLCPNSSSSSSLSGGGFYTGNNGDRRPSRETTTSRIARASASVKSLLESPPADDGDGCDGLEAFREGGRTARVALADLAARCVADLCSSFPTAASRAGEPEKAAVTIEPLHLMREEDGNDVFGTDRLRGQSRVGGGDGGNKRRRKKKKRSKLSNGRTYPPFMLERTDSRCEAGPNGETLTVYVRVICNPNGNGSSAAPTMTSTEAAVLEDVEEKKIETPTAAAVASSGGGSAAAGAEEDDGSASTEAVAKSAGKAVERFLTDLAVRLGPAESLPHASCAVLQTKLRDLLLSLNAVAFVADGSILPRRSGESSWPMACPPAIPFAAPAGSPMRRTLTVPMGSLKAYLEEGSRDDEACGDATEGKGDEKVSLTGLLIPEGVSLIVGGGYHGKSTLLQTIAAGIHNKVPLDGRHRSVTVSSAVTVRAEDGRYVSKTNVSAFISNLPSTPHSSPPDTTRFSTRDASGSTSQAANVSEAIEMGASALLVDEDVSAANFMARDGRMRALVADESITPLLYRVNGLYRSLKVSSVVVVGGVGDWLDVPDNVILLDKYATSDATEKARSVSYQFSYGHVQYAGRGVVHRLPWDKAGTPHSRRPGGDDGFLQKFGGRGTSVEIMEGGTRVQLHPGHDCVQGMESAEDEDEDVGCIDMSRCEQLFGKREELYGCGLCASLLLRLSIQSPTSGVKELLDRMDEELDKPGGLARTWISSAATSAEEDGTEATGASEGWEHLLEGVGFAFRPRRHEVAMALMRMRGLTFEDVPVTENDDEEDAARREEERKKKELADLWNSRRKGRT